MRTSLRLTLGLVLFVSTAVAEDTGPLPPPPGSALRDINELLDKPLPAVTKPKATFSCDEKGVRQAIGALTALADRNKELQAKAAIQEKEWLLEIKELQSRAANDPEQLLNSSGFEDATEKYAGTLEKNIEVIEARYLEVRSIRDTCDLVNLPLNVPVGELQKRFTAIDKVLPGLKKQPPRIRAAMEKFKAKSAR